MTPKQERQILFAAFPSIVIPLIRAGHLNASHLSDIALARQIIRRRIRYATTRMKWNIGLETGFATRAAISWKESHREEAIVLLAVALEQSLNTCLRLIVEARGHTSEHVTEQLRSLNVEPKLGWFFEMHSGRRFPISLARRARRIFEIRNSVVHFKAVFAHPDSGKDSYSRIKSEIVSLGKFRPKVFFDRFEAFCWDTVARCDPSIKLATELRERLFPDHE